MKSYLVRSAIAFTLIAIALSFTDGLARRWFPSLEGFSPRWPLILAVASGVAAWARSLWDADLAPAVNRRWGRFAALAGFMVLGLNALMLTGPSLPTDVDTCLFEKTIGKGFRHFLNCDSLEFMILASDPVAVTDHPVRQSRPMSFGVAYVVSRPLYLVPRLVKFGPYRPYAPEFAAYLIINLALMIAALLMLTSIIERASRVRAGTELLFVFVALGVNDVTKMFLWTPHVQIYNLFVGCLTLFLAVRLIERDRPLSTGEAVWLGLVMSTGVLIYGAFLIPLLCVILIQLAWYRRPVTAAFFALAAVLPFAVWVALLRAVTGRFYSHEIEAFRQFVWIADCVKIGAELCVPVIGINLQHFFNAASAVLIVPFLLLGGCRIAGFIWPAASRVPQDRRRAIGLAIAVTFAVTAVFLAAMGFYRQRLAWILVPPVLVAVALELQTIRLAITRPRRWVFDLGVFLTLCVYVRILMARQGPFE